MVEAYTWIMEKAGPSCDLEVIRSLPTGTVQQNYRLRGVDVYCTFQFNTLKSRPIDPTYR